MTVHHSINLNSVECEGFCVCFTDWKTYASGHKFKDGHIEIYGLPLRILDAKTKEDAIAEATTSFRPNGTFSFKFENFPKNPLERPTYVILPCPKSLLEHKLSIINNPSRYSKPIVWLEDLSH